jgi:hypothetical protein
MRKLADFLLQLLELRTLRHRQLLCIPAKTLTVRRYPIPQRLLHQPQLPRHINDWSRVVHDVTDRRIAKLWGILTPNLLIISPILSRNPTLGAESGKNRAAQ